MNDRYFACRTCCEYIDAGYRWCYWKLEHPGIIEANKLVSVDAVLGQEEYWRAQEAHWLTQLLPLIRQFLIRHQQHDLVFTGNDSDFLIEREGLHWINIEPVNVNDPGWEWSPRHFAQILKYTA